MRAIVVERTDGDDGAILSFRFESITQLFDQGDPAPLPDTELTEPAEEALLQAMWVSSG